MKVGLIGGTSLHHSDSFASWPATRCETRFGVVVCRTKGNLAVLDRHGPKGKTPPHAINHRANVALFGDLGVDTLISLNSVGSLRTDLAPGTLVSCADYVSFHPATFQDETLRPVAPVIGNPLLPEISGALDRPVESGKVYVQTRGPRFETKAEVRIIRQWGDVVGMTLGSEADLCAEAELPLTSLAMVDNFAHGLTESPLSADSFRRQLLVNRQAIEELLAVLVRLYG